MLFALLPLLACWGSDEPLPVRFTEVRRFGCEDCSGAEQFSMPLRVKSRGIGFDLAGEYMVTIHAEGDSDTQFVTLWRVSWDE